MLAPRPRRGARAADARVAAADAMMRRAMPLLLLLPRAAATSRGAHARCAARSDISLRRYAGGGGSECDGGAPERAKPQFSWR